MIPPPITSSRSGMSASSSAPVESISRGSSSGMPGSTVGLEPAAMMQCLKPTLVVPSSPSTERTLGEANVPAPAHDLDLALLGQPGQPAGELVDDGVLPAAQLVDVDLGLAEADAVGGGLLDVAHHAGDVQQRLRRDAADVEADAAEPLVALDQHGLEPEVGGAERGGVAAGAGAEHDHVGLDVDVALVLRGRRRRLRLGAAPPPSRAARPSSGGASPVGRGRVEEQDQACPRRPCRRPRRSAP